MKPFGVQALACRSWWSGLEGSKTSKSLNSKRVRHRHELALAISVPAYFGFAASTTDFKLAKPFSKSPPTILSMFMNMQNALLMKFLRPVIVHVTAVLVSFGL